MKSRQYRVEGVNPDWQKPAKETSGGAKSMREWQEDCFKNYAIDKKTGKVVRFLSVQAFCGSGKSILQVEIAVKDVVSSGYTQKQLIVVPQSHIHRGFVGEGECTHIEVKQHGKTYRWEIKPEHNFCDATGKKLAALKEWLLTPAKKLVNGFTKQMISGLNAVCTHAALVAVWKKLTDAEKSKAIHNLTLRVDEAHHIKNVYLEDEGSAEERLLYQTEATELGRLCKFILDAPAKTNGKLHLTTATMYRGDRRTILSETVRKKFVEYNLDWLEHFKTLGIEKFSLQYEEYESDPVDMILKRIRHEKRERHYVVVPSTGNKWRTAARLCRLFAGLRKIYPASQILDLVTPRSQSANKERLLAEPKIAEQGEPKFHVVVACMLGREGMDWCPCSRIHNSSVENSVTLAVQTVGRAFRKFAGKQLVKIYHYVKQFAVPENGVTKRELLSDRTNALLVCMQFSDMLNPIVLAPLGKSASTATRTTERVTLASVFGDQYDAATKQMLDGYDSLKDRTHAAVRELAETVYEASGVEFDRRRVVDGLIARLARQIAPDQSNGMDVAWVRDGGFDKLRLSRSVYYGDIAAADWNAIRCIMLDVDAEWDLAYASIRDSGIRASDTQGPHREWLERQRINYSRQGITIEKRAKLENIPGWNTYCVPRKGTPLSARAEALEIAKRRGGSLPPPGELHKRHERIWSAKRRHPELFEDITQDRILVKDTADWVHIAESLCKQNSGVLPMVAVIQRLHPGLDAAMRAHKELFEHISQDKAVRRSPQEWHDLAISLQNKNGGVLPSQSECARIGYGGLAQAMHKHKELFRDIKRSVAKPKEPKK